MKTSLHLAILVFFIISSGVVKSQQIEGEWNGILEVSSTKLPLVFHIRKDQSLYQTKMDSPSQGATGVPVNSTSFENGLLKLDITAIGAKYEGEVKSDTLIEGTFSQIGQRFPLRLMRGTANVSGPNRPQEPKPPFPYLTEEVVIKNTKDNVELAGTLSLPDGNGPFPAAILISGSGPQNRDEELFGHKPFLVIADFLTRNGVAVLRYDDRGVGHSTGNFSQSTTYDFATDAASAFLYLNSRKEIDQKKIGLIGHSEGGMIAPLVAAENPGVGYLVLLAGPGIPINSLMILQSNAIAKAGGSSQAQIESIEELNTKGFALMKSDADSLEQKLTALLSTFFLDRGMTKEQSEKALEYQIQQLTSPWMLNFIKIDPKDYLQRVRCPILALNGEKDLQVTPVENLEGIRRISQSSANKEVTAKMLPGLNHLFQKSSTGQISEYSQIEETFSPIALDEILIWLKKQKFLPL